MAFENQINAVNQSVENAKAATGRFFRRLLLWIFVILIILGILAYLSTKVSYSNGERAGVVSKLSEKGYVFKTNEGELNVGAQGEVGNLSQNIWAFSVEGDKTEIIDKLNDSMLSGKRVKLKYKQMYFQYFWMGDTKYFLTDVEVAE